MNKILYTIGYSNRSLVDFIAILKKNHINALCDVRSQPFSKFNSQYNKQPLKDALKTNGITYVFLGEELGARPKDSNCYIDNQAKYELIAKTELFQIGIKRIIEAFKKGYRPALMCAEKDPLVCHRTILVCRNLRSIGIRIIHIIDDNRNETNEEMENRMLKELDIHPSLFEGSNPHATLERAYDIQGEKIAYVSKPKI
ncbi:MAG: DUF488 domain-containing protein [Nitrospinae bacterium]|nr:DUF488 domain-containing protein [Nitrospinota bacterium]